jgi:hypothetical protein
MVHVRDPRARWCVPASRVGRIVSAAEWSAPGHEAMPVLDPLAALGVLPSDDDLRHRVIVLNDGGRELAVIAAGAIQIADIEPGDVLPLPPELSGIAAFNAIIASREASGPLSLVIDPRALAAIALTPLAPPVIASTSAVSPGAVSPGAVSVRNHA